MPFKLSALMAQATEKRVGDSASPQQPAPKKAKLPPADSDMVALEGAPRKPAARRLPPTAPLNVCVFKVTDKAGDVWSAFDGVPAKLFQIQLDHGARPSALFDIR